MGVERENLRNSRRLRKNDGHCRRGTLARWEVESPGAKTSCHAGMDIVSGEWKVSSDDKVSCSVPELEQSTVDGQRGAGNCVLPFKVHFGYIRRSARVKEAGGQRNSRKQSTIRLKMSRDPYNDVKRSVLPHPTSAMLTYVGMSNPICPTSKTCCSHTLA